MSLQKLQGETDLAYHKRLVYGKLLDKTLQDVDYSEIAEIIYGQPYSSDAARKMMYGSCKTMQALDKEFQKGIPEGDMRSEIENQIIGLRKEKQKFFDQRREFNKLVASEGRFEHIADRLYEAATNLNETIGLAIDSDCVHSWDDDKEAVLVLCDWHYGMVVDNAWNSFDTDICKRRVNQIVADASARIKLHECSTLHIVVLGDLFHGSIHTSARVASEELVADQIMQVSELLAQAIAELSRSVGSVQVHMTYGNHGRTVQNKKDSIHRDNIERLIPWWLKWRLAGIPSIVVMDESDNEFLQMDICGSGICASHGDNDNVRVSARVLPTLFQRKFGKKIDYILLADKHHREVYEEFGITSMICGSLCGSDDYANDKRLFSDPEQLLLIMDYGRGVDAEYHLKCE